MELDVLGEAMLDCQAGEKEALISVNSDITETEELQVEYFFRSFEGMPPLEQTALQMCSGRIADLGAGAGSHALYLQEKGLDVTAFEISPGACQVMRERGVQRVRQKDIRDLGTEKFDTILMLMNGLGLVGDLEGLDLFLSRIKENLNPGGRILVDSSDISYMFFDEDGALVLDLNADYHGEVHYQMEYKGKKGKPFNWLFVDFQVLEDYAAIHNFSCTFIQDDDHYHYLVALQVNL